MRPKNNMARHVEKVVLQMETVATLCQYELTEKVSGDSHDNKSEVIPQKQYGSKLIFLSDPWLKKWGTNKSRGEDAQEQVPKDVLSSGRLQLSIKSVVTNNT